jgi:hypothetical protein
MSTKRIRLHAGSVAAVAVLLSVGLGCSRFVIPGSSNLFEGDGAATAASAIKAHAGTEKVNVVRVEVRPDKMTVTVQSPKNPKEQDEYTYERGSASGPKPVMIHNVFADYIPSTTEIGEINFAAIPATIKRALEVAEAEGGKVTLISMDNQRASTASPELKGQKEGEAWALTWRLFVEGTRIRKYFWADKQGKLYEKAF